MSSYVFKDEEWIDSEPVFGLPHKTISNNGCVVTVSNYQVSIEFTERTWRDSELVRTDELVKLPDYPIDLLPYRVALRDYPAQPDFPNSTRPTT